MSATDRLPVTAIVPSHNEAHLLARCIGALTFCDELIVVDIASTDDTAAVARRLGATVLPHRFVSAVEEARFEAIATARHEWVLLRDPDEIVPERMRAQIVELFPGLDPDVGLVTGPIQYYVGAHPLRGTVWGGVQGTRVLARRDLIEFPRRVHGKLVRKAGSRDLAIPFTGDNAIEHYWAHGYREVVEKHRRYIGLEAAARVAAGERTSIRRIAATPFSAFADSFVRQRGYLDGVRGIALSVVWSAYRTGIQLALFCAQGR